MSAAEEITLLQNFKDELLEWDQCRDPGRLAALRTNLNQNKYRVRQIVIEAGCFVTVTISPPPITGGLIMRNVDMFQHMFDGIYNMSLVPRITDMLDQAIGVLKLPPQTLSAEPSATIEHVIKENYACCHAYELRSAGAR